MKKWPKKIRGSQRSKKNRNIYLNRKIIKKKKEKGEQKNYQVRRKKFLKIIIYKKRAKEIKYTSKQTTRK